MDYISLRMILLHSLFLSVTLFYLFIFSMEMIRVASLNINGGRDGSKRAMVAELINIKNVNVSFLQETHTDCSNEEEWSRWWEGESVFSHGSNLSAGVAILFSKNLNLKILSTEEMEKGRVLMVAGEINDLKVIFINVYAPNNGSDRVEVFRKLQSALRKCDNDSCTTNFLLDSNREESHSPSSNALQNIIKEFELVDVWRNMNKRIRQYTWVKILDSNVTGARLDSIYISKTSVNRVSNIFPNGFSDHHIATIDFNITTLARPRFHWHFNTKLLQDRSFSEKFGDFWKLWKLNKGSFENVTQWWEVGKTQIKVFCQSFLQYYCVC